VTAQPIVGVSGVPEPIVAVRATQPGDLTVVTQLFEAASEELKGHKGAWLWERADAPFASKTVAAEVLCGAEPDPLGRVWTSLVGLVDEQVFAIGAGFLVHLTDGGTLGSIRVMYVGEGARSVGVGDLLIVGLAEHYRDIGCVGVDAWALPGERETKNFYEAHGFSARVLTVHQSFIGKMHDARPWERVLSSDLPSSLTS
jgi:GNAT superfamily N-acetyltransferase